MCFKKINFTLSNATHATILTHLTKLLKKKPEQKREKRRKERERGIKNGMGKSVDIRRRRLPADVLLTYWSQREMTQQTDWREKQTSLVACISEDLKC